MRRGSVIEHVNGRRLFELERERDITIVIIASSRDGGRATDMRASVRTIEGSAHARSVVRSGATRRRVARGTVSKRCALGDDDVEFMVREFQPWVKDAEGAAKCYEYMKVNHECEFSLSKARVVMASLRAEHAKLPEAAGPFALPKTWPGFLHVLERCSERV